MDFCCFLHKIIIKNMQKRHEIHRKNVQYLSESRHYGTNLINPNWFVPQRCGPVLIGEQNLAIPPLSYLPYLPYTTSPTPSYPIPPPPVLDHHPCLSASRIELSRKDWSIRIEMLRPNIVQFALAYPNCPIIKLPQPIRSRQSGLTMLLSVTG